MAIELAGRLGSTFDTRDGNTISSLTRRHNVAAAIVVGLKGIHLVYNGRRYGFHPNVALHRVVALRAGRKDRLVEAAELKSGDTVLDCTCGLGSDAIKDRLPGKFLNAMDVPIVSDSKRVWYGRLDAS